MKKRTLLFLLIIGIVSNVSFAQGVERPVSDMSFRDRIFFGGNFGLQFGTVTFVDVSPVIGYRITDRLSTGPGLTYIYYRERFGGWDFQTSMYGGRVFGRYDLFEFLFLHSEYELLNLERWDLGDRINITNILVGGGYRQHLGGWTYLNLLALWNINESAYSPYRNPIIRMGINVGL